MDLQREQIERQFDRAAATYDSVASLQRQMAARLLEKVPVDFAGSLADLGCGTGDFLDKLKTQVSDARLTGVDLSAAMLARARQRNPEAAFAKADLMDLAFKDNTFDIVTSNAAIQWCDSNRAFDEIRRVLRSGGQALISTFGPSTMRQWRDALTAVDGDPERVHSFQAGDVLAQQLRHAGFENVESVREMIDVRFETVREMLDSIRKLGATNARQQRTKGLSSRRWLERLTEELLVRADMDGKLTLTYECLFFFAN